MHSSEVYNRVTHFWFRGVIPPTHGTYQRFACIPRIKEDLVRTGFVAVLGPRRSGKTTLLNALGAAWDGAWQQVDLVPWDSSQESDVSAFARCGRAILSKLSGRRPSDAPSDLLKELLALIPTIGPRTVLVLDGIDGLPRETSRHLLSILRALYQETTPDQRDRQLRFLVAGSASLAALTAGPTSPLVNLAAIHRVTDLSREESMALLRNGFAESAIQADPELLGKCHEFAGGDRGLLQRLGTALETVVHLRPGKLDSSCLDLATDQLTIYALQKDAEWPVVRELLDDAVQHPVVLDVIEDLLDSDSEVKKRELSGDLGWVELSGVVTIEPTGYLLRSGFHAGLCRRLFDPTTRGDLRLLQGNWSRAETQYRLSVPQGKVTRHFATQELILALATCLLGQRTTRAILTALCTGLQALCRFSGVGVVQVRGRDASGFRVIAGNVENNRESQFLMEQVAQRRVEKTIEIENGVRWILPFVLDEGHQEGLGQQPGGAYTKWLLIIDEQNIPSRLDELRPLLFFVWQLLSDRDRRDFDKVLEDITHSLVGVRSYQEVLLKVVRALRDLTEAQIAAILLPEQRVDGHWLRLEVSCEQGQEPRRTDELLMQPAQPGRDGCGVTGHVFATGLPTIIGNSADLNRDSSEVSPIRDEMTQKFRFLPWWKEMVSELAVPILYEGKPIGILDIESDVPYLFHQGDLKRVVRLADLAAIAMVRGQDLDRVRQEAVLARTFGGIAHEVRRHSSIVKDRVTIMQRKLDSGKLDNQRTQDGLSMIGRNADAIWDVVEDFRWLAHLEPGIEDRVDLALVLKEVLESLFKEHREELIDIPKCDLPKDSVIVSGRFGLLCRVLRILLENAIDAVRTEGHDPGPDSLQVCLTSNQKMAELEVLDRGIGLPAKGDVFAPYFTTKPGQGLGLGLAICRQIVEGHKGKIEAYQKGDWTVFQVRIPLAD